MVYHNEDGSITSNAAPRITASSDVHPAILEERAAYEDTIARLTAELDWLKRSIFGSADYHPSLTVGQFAEMAQTTNEARRHAVARAEAAEALLARAYEAARGDAGLVAGEGPQVAGYTCRGCRHFHSEYWRESDGEGGMDSGTSATCLLLGKNISSYCGSNPPPPDWCPKPRALPIPADLAARLGGGT